MFRQVDDDDEIAVVERVSKLKRKQLGASNHLDARHIAVAQPRRPTA